MERVPSDRQSLRAILEEHCQSEQARRAGWRVVFPEDSGWWMMVHHSQGQAHPQGWKLHISATIVSIKPVLARVLAVLMQEDASFKVIASIARLHALNCGAGGFSQIGKAITIYPRDDEQAVRLAAALDRATHGLRGPAIPSDRPLRSGSLVHYRYGSFGGPELPISPGSRFPALVTPENTLIPDTREPGVYAPPWAVDPFIAAGIAKLLPGLSPLLNGRYLIGTTLASSARGTVARAVDIEHMRLCILKRAAHDGQMSPHGLEARDYLRRGAELLQQLAPSPLFPAVFDLLPYQDDLILVMENIPGITLAQHVLDLSRQAQVVEVKQVLAWMLELAQALAMIHSHAWVYRDLSLTNIIVTPDQHLRLIDFDAAHNLREHAVSSSLGTPGYLSPEHYAGKDPAITDDIYGLGALCYFLATGSSPPFPPPFSTPTTTIDPVLARIIKRCTHPQLAKRFSSMASIIAVLTTDGTAEL